MGRLPPKGDESLNITALALIIIGALNWLLVGLFQFDLVAWICGGQAALLSRIIYSLVGLAGLWGLTFFRKVSDCND